MKKKWNIDLRWSGLALALVGLSAGARAQEEEPLVTDRPDFTESAQTLAPNRFQVESGISYERQGDERTTRLGEVLVRIGLNERTELRVGVPSYLRVRSDGSEASGFEDAFLGAKFRLTAQDASTKLAILAGSKLPTGARSVAPRKFQPEVVLAAEFPPVGSVSLAANVGYARAAGDEDEFDQFRGSVSANFGISPKTGAFVEVFALSRDEAGGDSKQYLDTGLTYLLNPDTQLDTRVGFGLGNDVDGSDHFYGVGLSRRF